MAKTMSIINGDIDCARSSGRPVTITGRVKLSQDLKEFFSINVQPNGLGAGIEQLIGVVEVSPGSFVSLVDRQVRDGVAEFISLQNSDSRISRSTDEQVVSMNFFMIEQDQTDPTKYVFRANFVTQAGRDMAIGGPIAL